MALYLQHTFDPEVSQRRLKPTPGAKKNLHNLGYVQNVHAGDILAELIPAQNVKNPDPRFLRTSPVLPQGENTHINADNPAQLLASKNGYVTYAEGKICVFTVLKVLSDINFHTGNIIFLGDTAINGNVRAGFEVQGSNVLITGMVEGGTIRAQKGLRIQGGVRGAAKKKCLLSAKADMHLNFIEHAEIHCLGQISIEKNALHSTLYASKNIVIKDHLVGGTIHGRQGVLVAGPLGNRAATPTRIFLGYNPMQIRKLEKIDAQLEKFEHDIHHLTLVAGHLAPQATELSRRLHATRKKHAYLTKARHTLWNALQVDEGHMTHCKVVAMGQVHPGVEIAIGQAYLQVNTPLQSVVFSLVNNEIVHTPYIPVPKP